MTGASNPGPLVGAGSARARRRVAARLVVLGGALALLWLGEPLVPRRQRLELRLDPPPAGATRLTLSVQREGEAEPCAGAELAVSPGQRRLEHVLELPPGTYRVDATLWPSSSGEAALASRAAPVVLEGTAAVVPLRIEE